MDLKVERVKKIEGVEENVPSKKRKLIKYISNRNKLEIKESKYSIKLSENAIENLHSPSGDK